VAALVDRYRRQPTEVALTQATVRELNTRTRFHVLPTENTGGADAVLKGTVLSETIQSRLQPLTFRSVQTTATELGAQVRVTSGKQLADGYPLIAAVGDAAL